MISERINGFQVIAIAAIPDSEGMRPGRRVVIVDRSQAYQGRGRFVVAKHVAGEEGWWLGHYIDDLELAAAAFSTRWLEEVRCNPLS